MQFLSYDILKFYSLHFTIKIVKVHFWICCLRLKCSRSRKTASFLMSHRLKKYIQSASTELHEWSENEVNVASKCWKSPIFEGKLQVFISYLNEMKIVNMFYNSSLFLASYSLFLPFFVPEIFKFKHTTKFSSQTFCFHFQIRMIWTAM